MSTVLKYWGQSFPVDSCIIERRIDVELSEQDLPYAETRQWFTTVGLAGDGPTALLALARPLELALGRPFGDLVFQTDTGLVLYAMPNATSTSGVTIRNLRNPPNPGHLATAYYIEFTAQATYQYSPALLGTQAIMLEYRETLKQSGGGPRFGLVECSNAIPQKFKLTDRTICRLTQAGTMRTLIDYGTFPDPLYPDDLLPDQTQKSIERGKNRKGVDEFTINWQYEFATANLITI